MSSRRKKILKRFFEFFVIGLGFGVIEDLIAISLASDARITMQTVWIAFFVALPFAAFSELVVDHPRFLHRIFGGNEDETEGKN